MAGLSLVTIALSLLVLVLVKDPERLNADKSQKGGYLDILKMRELWFILPLIFVNYGVVGGIRGIWAGPYLDLVHGLSAVGIGNIMFAMAIAMAVGSFAYGPADRIFNSRKWVVFVGCLGTLGTMMYWTLNPTITTGLLTILLVIMGFCSLCYGVLMAHATANIPAHLAGRGVTLVNFFNMGGVGAMQWLSSEVYRRNADEAVPVAGFESVFWFYLVAFAAVLAIYAFSRDAKPNAVKRQSLYQTILNTVQCS